MKTYCALMMFLSGSWTVVSVCHSVINTKYTFKNDTDYEVVFRGSFGSAPGRCLSEDFVINLYPRGSQFMAKPCVIMSFDVELKKDGKRFYVGSYKNIRGDCCDRRWILAKTIHGSQTQFHLITE